MHTCIHFLIPSSLPPSLRYHRCSLSSGHETTNEGVLFRLDETSTASPNLPPSLPPSLGITAALSPAGTKPLTKVWFSASRKQAPTHHPSLPPSLPPFLPRHHCCPLSSRHEAADQIWLLSTS